MAVDNLRVSHWQVEPFGTVDLGEFLHLPAPRRPFDFKTVAYDGGNIEVAFERESDHAFAAALANLAERI